MSLAPENAITPPQHAWALWLQAWARDRNTVPRPQ